ncbi:MAG: SGNH/GDSL hydrolase family protein [Acidobacteria bacterium]|nr:SGNH/GDSL hydrolase family protein [Acidobacteriota bacterium]
MTAEANRPSLVHVIAVATLAATYAALYWRLGPFSALYRGVLAGGGVVVALALLSLLIPSPLTRARTRLRVVAIVAPWAVVAVLTATNALWWTQQASALRLFVLCVMAAWSGAWCAGPWPSVPGTGRIARSVLIGIAVGLWALSLGGLVSGLTPFGAGVSAVMACVAAATLAVARYGRSHIYGNMVAITMSTMLSFAVAEAAIRVLHIGDSVIEVGDASAVRQFHHIIPPRSAYINQPAALDEFPPTLIETNGFGTRGPEVPPAPVDLLIIGDSMVEARQLPWDQTLGARLPQTLAARSVNATVVSQGVRGWSPLLEWNWYLKAGRRLQPRTVVLFFFWNDLWTTGDEERTFRAVMRPDGRPDYFDVPVEPWWVWYSHLRTMRLAGEMANRLELASVKRSVSGLGEKAGGLDLTSAVALARKTAGEAILSPDEADALLTEPMERLSPRARQIGETGFWPGIRPLERWTDDQKLAAAKTAQKLRLFAEDVAADGGRLVVLYVPNSFQVSSAECPVSRPLVGLGDDRLLPPDSGIQAWLRAVAQEHKFELLDPSAAMRDFLRTRPADAPALYLRADCHWSAAGHQFMADYLADWYAALKGPRP